MGLLLGILPSVYSMKPPSSVTNPSPGITLYADKLMDSYFHPLSWADETESLGACFHDVRASNVFR